MITRLMTLSLLCLASLPARADLCGARSGRNARAITGCPSLGLTAALTGTDREPAKSDAAVLALDTQIPIGPFVIRAKGLLNSDDNNVQYGAGFGLAWLARVPAINLFLNLGGEYAPPFSDAIQVTPTIPTLQRYFLPDTHQVAAQGSLGIVAGPFGLRLDGDYAWAFSDVLGDRRTLQFGGTVAWDLAPIFGFRVGYDRSWIHDDAAGLTPIRDIFTPGAHFYTRMIDVGVGFGFVKECPETNDCEPDLHVILDLTLPLGPI